MFWPVVIFCGMLSGQCFVIEDGSAPFDKIHECTAKLPAMSAYGAAMLMDGQMRFDNPLEEIGWEHCCITEPPRGEQTDPDICALPSA